MATDRKPPVHQPIHHLLDQPAILFLTVCTKARKRILARRDVQCLLQSAWRDAKGWLVGRYLIMPDHIHLFCSPETLDQAPELRRWVRYWKTLVSRRWPQPAEQPIWQLDFWDTQLRHPSHYDEKWEYVRQNPVRAGLVAESSAWPFQGELHELRW